MNYQNSTVKHKPYGEATSSFHHTVSTPRSEPFKSSLFSSKAACTPTFRSYFWKIAPGASLHCRDDPNLSFTKPLRKPFSIQTAECGCTIPIHPTYRCYFWKIPSESSLHCRGDRNLSFIKPLRKPCPIQTSFCNFIKSEKNLAVWEKGTRRKCSFLARCLQDAYQISWTKYSFLGQGSKMSWGQCDNWKGSCKKHPWGVR
jgi:hypothetical protein